MLFPNINYYPQLNVFERDGLFKYFLQSQWGLFRNFLMFGYHVRFAVAH